VKKAITRRTFFSGAAAAGAAAFTLPAWIERAFAQDRPAAPDPLDVVSAAYRRAQRAGKPLLVLVVPAEGSSAWIRGQHFGELINHAGPEAMADLALVEVVCASLEVLHRLAPLPPSPRGREPAQVFMVLVETDAVPARVQLLTPRVAPSVDFFRGEEGRSWEQMQIDEDRVIDRRIAVLSGAIHDFVAPDAATVRRRATQARARLDAATLRQIEAALPTGMIPPSLADRGAALLAEAALTATPRRRGDLTTALAAAATARLRQHEVAGAQWARATGCGSYVEAETTEHLSPPCGMGHVSPRSARVLQFYAR
jgi:hypothetical protein